MKTPYPHILSCIAVSILTACGGGGGGGTPSVAPTPTYPIVQPGNIPNPSGQTERTATSPAGSQADANNALEASEENIHKEVENSVNSTQTSSENQNQDVKADSNDKAEAERKVAEKAAKAKAEEERKAAEEAAEAKAEAERKAAEKAAKAKAEEERKAAEEAAKAKAEAERKAAEEAAKAKAEAERKAAEEAAKAKAKAEAERKAAEEAAKAKAEAERKAAEEAAKAKAEAERKAAEEAAKAKAKAEAERKAAEEAAKAKAEAERKAAEEAAKAKAEAERKAAEEAAKAKAEAERKAAEEATKVKAEEERKAAEEAAKAKAEAERKAAEEAAKAKAEAERKAAEEAAKAEAEHKAAEEVTPKAEVAPAMQSIGGFYTMLSIDGADNKVINRVGNPDVLEVNGQKINLLPQTFDAANGMLSLSDNKIIRAIGTHLQYGHYGFYGSKKENGELNSSLVFYQGLMTPVEAMPQTGSAIYQGNAFYNDVSNINTVGSSLFNVDFGEKTLTGGVYSAEGRFNPVMLQANIAGNRFVYVDATTKNSMSGIFLGPQAEEMAGRFDHPSEGKSGTFGAAMLKD